MIIPKPNYCNMTGKGVFEFNQDTRLITNGLCKIGAQAFKQAMVAFGIVVVECTENVSNAVTTCLDKKLGLGDEGYKLEINELAIKISAQTEAGILYGYQTLRQIIFRYKKELPSLEIIDAPLHKERAFMLDVGRYFYPVEDVKKFIDIMVSLKLNLFHWHLSEDQGWRIEIKKYPLLTQKGSMRSHTNFNCKPHGGSYSQEQIKEIVDYCHERHISVMPEIDMPGHMQAALACYPYLGCFDRKLSVATHWGVKHDILCGGKPEVLQFVKDVLEEVMQLFPDKYIHLGGDEAVKTRWKLCPTCQKKMKQLGLKTEDELQSAFMGEVAKFVEENGRTAVTWNESKEDDVLPKSICWTYYQGMKDEQIQKMVKGDKTGARGVFDGDSASYYFDLPYGTVPLKKTYEYQSPLYKHMKSDEMLGAECFLWTEYVPTMKKAMWCMFPRVLAFAEVAWTKPENRSYDEFVKGLSPEFWQQLKKHGVVPASQKRSNPSKFSGKVEKLIFGRRVLHWQGLHNLIDNAKVKKIAAKYAKAAEKSEKK